MSDLNIRIGKVKLEGIHANLKIDGRSLGSVGILTVHITRDFFQQQNKCQNNKYVIFNFFDEHIRSDFLDDSFEVYEKSPRKFKSRFISFFFADRLIQVNRIWEKGNVQKLSFSYKG